TPGGGGGTTLPSAPRGRRPVRGAGAVREWAVVTGVAAALGTDLTEASPTVSHRGNAGAWAAQLLRAALSRLGGRSSARPRLLKEGLRRPPRGRAVSRPFLSPPFLRRHTRDARLRRRQGRLCQASLRPSARPPPASWEPCPSRQAWPCHRPWTGPVVYVLDLADRLISKACPFAAAGIMVGSIYWTAVTYGAVTVMQVVGHKEGLDVMERADPLFLLIGLPTIPVMLILGKMIRWEDYVLRLWRKYSNKLQILNSIFPGIGCPVPRIPAEANPLADHVSATRILCGALVFPTIATIVGKLMFSSVNSNLQRTILGGIAFVAIKGAFKVYFKQQQYLRQAHRKILNYPEQEGA
uniref:Membrane associated ring-CH-type finger 5 n=1 Tax=Otus sunia TaxID=257818 RepID=A0A8C8AQZ4_9STRI